MVGDSNFVVRQTDGTFALKEISLAPSQSLVCRSCVSDEIDVEFTHVNRSTNRHADSLATLASKRKKFEDDEAVIKISKRRTPAPWNFNDKLYEDVIKEGDWRHAVIQELKQSVSSVHMARKDLKCFTKLCGNFDYKMSDGVLARCLGIEEAAKTL